MAQVHTESSLTSLRAKIDRLDNDIHDLVMQRAGLIMDIARAKRSSGEQVVQPAREARMLRRLLARHDDSLPGTAIIQIWRELVGAVAMQQTGLSACVYTGEAPIEYWDMARNYFGHTVPLKQASSQMSALSMLRDEQVSFAVMPWPEPQLDTPWWYYLYRNEQANMQVIQHLPFFQHDIHNHMSQRALVVARLEFGNSGDDTSLVVLDLSETVSRTRIMERLGDNGHALTNIYSCMHPDQPGRSLNLLELREYVAPGTGLGDMAGLFKDGQARSVSIGGYPVIAKDGQLTREAGK
jgi:chorismate mutase